MFAPSDTLRGRGRPPSTTASRQASCSPSLHHAAPAPLRRRGRPSPAFRAADHDR